MKSTLVLCWVVITLVAIFSLASLLDAATLKTTVAPSWHTTRRTTPARQTYGHTTRRTTPARQTYGPLKPTDRPIVGQNTPTGCQQGFVLNANGLCQRIVNSNSNSHRNPKPQSSQDYFA